MNRGFVILEGHVLVCANCAVASDKRVIDDYEGDSECEVCTKNDGGYENEVA